MITRLLYSLIFAGSLVFLSCGKNSDSNNNTSPGNFSWTCNGATYTARVDTAFNSATNYALGAPVIIATQGTRFFAPSADLYIFLTALSPGTYSFTGSGTNKLMYTDPVGNNLDAGVGTFTITSNTGGRLAGNFSVTLTNSTALSGSFSNVPVVP